jgi:hypothetical protein
MRVEVVGESKRVHEAQELSCEAILEILYDDKSMGFTAERYVPYLESGEIGKREYVSPTNTLMQASSGIGECQTQFSVTCLSYLGRFGQI